MKTKSNKTSFLQIAVLLAFIIGFFLTSSCKKNNSEGSNQNSGIRTCSGAVTITQDSLEFDDLLDFCFSEGSSNNGTFFRKSDGAVGIFSGTGSGSIVTINGSMKDDPSSTFSGTVQLINDDLSVNITGTDNVGPYTCSGILSQQDCIDIAGTYYAQESATFTITMNGKSETETQSGNGTVVFDQTECHVSYSVPGTNTGRDGELIGNMLMLSGQFVIPASNEVILSENSYKAKVTIIDNYQFEFVGTGKAKGTYQGVSFEINGSSTGIFDRRFKVAAAFLHGGPSWWPTGQWNAGDELGLLCAQAGAVDRHNVIAKGFGASTEPSQINLVTSWYNSLNTNSYRPNLILVGHSLGGNAVTVSPIQDVYSRITIDPWSPSWVVPNQRTITIPRSSTGGGFKNILASTTDILPGYDDPHLLLGYKIQDLFSDEWIEDTPPTNHFSIVHRVWEKGYVKDEVTSALYSYKSQDAMQNTLFQIYSNSIIIRSEQPLSVCFGWSNSLKK